MCRRPPAENVCSYTNATEVVKVMSELMTGREPASERLGAPLIELAGVEKTYRTGQVEFQALRGST